ncbi:type I-U CRISPR-associated helicase/endonuclease Cas3 [Streptomyces sp. NPDC014983]|uniref:type I-G CRISPR-associated helicase/endonuclease Cas3g n=1 Tax=Streptomyces sp. NPDC014983 TaxID=3364933 RepID=UPI003700C087
MKKLDLDDFPDFVHDVFGYAPFPWQTDYLHAVAGGAPWPDLDVPTGLGKTSLVDIWAFLLAWQADHQVARTVPLRLFFVVDRRLVVDQAHQHAQHLRKELQDATAGTLLGRVAAALRRLGGEEEPLEVVRMRGGVDWASRWLRSPAQPAVVTATVDQYGSRLLFRGYHTSPRMRPIDAALCGIDALLALDEAHIALPLLTTAADCAAYQATATDPALAGRAVKVVSLSATATGPDRPRLGISDRDRRHPVAGPRLNAQRYLTLLDASTTAKNGTAAFARAADLAVDALLPVVRRPVIGVIVNTIAAARTTHQLFAARGDVDTLLLIGRSRSADRELLLRSAHLTELLNGVKQDRARPLVVVATQTVEVGLDASVAGMITEASSAASMIQRLGRLDRKGEYELAPAIVVRAHAPENPAEIPVYGAAAAHTWNWLTTHTSVLDEADITSAELQEALAAGLLVNPTTLPTLLNGVDTESLNVAAPRIPVVHRTLLDSWARTEPTPVPDQPTAPFLHGLDTSPEDVQLLWRADLPTDAAGRPDWQRWMARLVQTPPHPGETVAIPARQLRRFLTQPAADVLSDLEGEAEPAEPEPKPSRRPADVAPALRWDGPEAAWVPVTGPNDIRPGSAIVMPSTYAGHDAYGWTGTTGPAVPDLGDFPPHQALAATRIDAGLLANLADLDEPLRETLTRAISTAITKLEADEEEQSPTEVIHHLLDHLIGHLPETPKQTGSSGRFTGLVRERLLQLRLIPKWDLAVTARSPQTGHVVIDPDDPARLLLTPRHLDDRRPERTAGVGDEDADASSLTRQVSLAQHSKAVAARAATYATRLDLPATLTNAVDTGAHAHDCAKSHPRFQVMLCAGDRLLAESLPEPQAKSGMDPADLQARRRASRLARWDPGLRHEALSAAAVKQWLDTHPEHTAGLDPDLIIHLVAAHHGYSRPLLPPVIDTDPIDVTCVMPDGQPVTLNSTAMGVDWDGPDRFTDLNRRYGPWGLALLEALVRLADMACSEEGS